MLIQLIMIRPKSLNCGEKWWVRPCILDLSLRVEGKGNHALLLLSKTRAALMILEFPTDSRVENIFLGV